LGRVRRLVIGAKKLIAEGVNLVDSVKEIKTVSNLLKFDNSQTEVDEKMREKKLN
jgi:hypothetical protein